MPFLDWVNKNRSKEGTREVPYHSLKQGAVYGDVSGADAVTQHIGCELESSID